MGQTQSVPEPTP
jgi:hypothetical protein